MECLMFSRIISDYDPIFNLILWKVFLIYQLWLVRHVFIPYRTHVVVVTVIDISFLLMLQSFFQLIKSFFLRDRSFIFTSFGLIHNSCFPTDIEMLAECLEPSDQSLVSSEWPKLDLIKRLLKTQNLHCFFLCQYFTSAIPSKFRK